MVEDFKNSTTEAEVTGDLLNNYGEAVIKDITPAPTGVEVRGTRYDSSNVPLAPSSSVPSTTNPSSTPSSTTVPRAVSGSAVFVPGVVTLLAMIAFA